MSDRYEHLDDRVDAPPPDLGELDAYLERAGARWRATSTEIGAVAGRLRERAGRMTAAHTTMHAATSEPAATPRLRIASVPAPPHRGRSPRSLPVRLAGSLVAVLAMVAVVGALAALLLSASPKGTTSGGVPTQHGRWVALGALDADVQFDANDLPAIAPSDPRVVYETMVYGIQQHHAGGLRRTDDGGATWHDLPLPIHADHVGHAGMLVSPLDPRTVFLSLISTAAADCPPGTVEPITESNSPDDVICRLQYTSTDGGAHWAMTHLPTPSVLTPNLTNNTMPSLQASHVGGQAYLYALLDCVGTASCSRLGTSTDSGRTWRLADSPLMAAGAENVCAVAADQRGPALFAVTTATTCYYDAQKPLTLWRSDDAGAHWSRQGILATPNLRGVLIAHPEGTNRALMSMALPRTTGMATDKMGGKYPTFSTDPADLKVSADGGKTWKSAPAAGIPAGLKPSYDIGLMGTLSDGSVVVDFIAQNRQENFGGSTLFAWKLGDTAWRQLAPPVTWEAGSLLAVPGSTPGADTLYLTMTSRGMMCPGFSAHPTYSFLRFNP